MKRALLKALPAPLWALVRPMFHGTTSFQRELRHTRSRLRYATMPRALRRGTTPLMHGGKLWVAHPTERFQSVEVIAENCRLVADTLAAAGIRHILLEADTNRRRVLGVSNRDRRRVLAVLAKELFTEAVYAAPVLKGQTRRPRLLGLEPLPAKAHELRLFQVRATSTGTFLSGSDLGCDIQFWNELDDDAPPGPAGEQMVKGTWVARSRNRWSDIIGTGELCTQVRHVDGKPREVLAATSLPHFESVTFPVDAVYTWVDGSDVEWQRRKAAALAEATGAPLSPFSINDSRFMTRDELRYSLRSLEMYAGWVNHIYLVTDDQVPAWLDVDHPKLTVVSHRELFGKRGKLPTFNSHAIESQLHHIEGLSEHFLYLNDDVFFGRPVDPTRFFLSNGMSKFFLSQAKIALGQPGLHDWPVMAAGKHNRDLIARRFGKQPTNKMKHVPHSMQRGVLQDIEQAFPLEHARTARAQFRAITDIAIPSSLAHYYGYFTQRAVPGSIRYFYADIARRDTPARLNALLRRRDVDVFCLNDHDSSSVSAEEQKRIITTFLDSYFPLASSFERAEASEGAGTQIARTARAALAAAGMSS
ncbi:stealth family protein [Terrabacter sp. NPDC080008]|uniref:stealth family protein n=1 Tax=Terrabacter sp. NPDC080008 TaxID=3155176 RepID=UPI00344EF630